jgi:hypothetical protein
VYVFIASSALKHGLREESDVIVHAMRAREKFLR